MIVSCKVCQQHSHNEHCPHVHQDISVDQLRPSLTRSRPYTSPFAEITILRLALSSPRKRLPRLLRREVVTELLELARRRDSNFTDFRKHLRFVGLRCHERSHQVWQSRAQRVDLGSSVSLVCLPQYASKNGDRPVLVGARAGRALPRDCALAIARAKLRLES